MTKGGLLKLQTLTKAKHEDVLAFSTLKGGETVGKVSCANSKLKYNAPSVISSEKQVISAFFRVFKASSLRGVPVSEVTKGYNSCVVHL